MPDGGLPSTMPSTSPWFVYALREVTEAAARAAFAWIGRGRKKDGDGAAVHAMREALGQLGIDGVVVIGEGDKDGAPELYRGERVGHPAREPQFDIAVDPVEGTTYLAKGLTNAMAVIALAPRGAMLDPGPCFYMEKLAAPPAARGRIDPDGAHRRALRQLADRAGQAGRSAYRLRAGEAAPQHADRGHPRGGRAGRTLPGRRRRGRRSWPPSPARASMR